MGSSLGAGHRIRVVSEQLLYAAGERPFDTSNVSSIFNDDLQIRIFDPEVFNMAIVSLKEYLKQAIENGEFVSFDQEALDMFAHALARLSDIDHSFILPFDVFTFANLTIYKYMTIKKERETNRPHLITQKDALDEALVNNFAMGEYNSCESILKNLGRSFNRKLFDNEIEDYFCLRALFGVAVKSGWIDVENIMSMYSVTTQRLASSVASSITVTREDVEDFYNICQLVRTAMDHVDGDTRNTLLKRVEEVNARFDVGLNSSSKHNERCGSPRDIAKILRVEASGFLKSLQISHELAQTKTGAILEIAIQGASRFGDVHFSGVNIGVHAKLRRQQMAIDAQKLNPTRMCSAELVVVAKKLFEDEKQTHEFSDRTQLEISKILKGVIASDEVVRDPSTNFLGPITV